MNSTMSLIFLCQKPDLDEKCSVLGVSLIMLANGACLVRALEVMGGEMSLSGPESRVNGDWVRLCDSFRISAVTYER